MKHRFIHRIVLLINVLFAFALLLANLAPYLDPQNFWPVAFAGLAYPPLLLLNLLFMLYWFIIKRGYWWLSLTIVLLGWYQIMNFVALGDEVKGKDLRVMTFNARGMDAYNTKGRLATRDSIISMIREADPDILCLQEFCYTDTGDFQNVDAIKKLGLVHFFFYKNVRHHNHIWGMAIFSNKKLVNTGVIEFEGTRKNGCMYADVEVNKKKLRIYNIHLQSVGFEKGDYDYLDNIQDSDFTPLRKILSKIKNAFAKRSQQAKLVAEHIARSPIPVVLAGDLNDSPHSFTYSILRDGRKDGFLEAGIGISGTHVGPYPFLRIDYVLHDDELRAGKVQTIRRKFSDHYPVVCDLTFK
ncbi:MAG: endonuclease/exonuclease/phosphatase family protein [Bacteroidetes bacterium]|nr:endonuclease/exonuclease/phosphatase family protein [Bacteroidota bacterium]